MKADVSPEIYYLEDNCFHWTFEAEKVKRAVEENCAREGKVLNLFAGKVHLNVDEVRVDIDNEFCPNFNCSAEYFIELAKKNKQTYPTIIYDPPWNARKSKEFYKGKGTKNNKSKIGIFTKLKDDIVLLLSRGGNIISLGYEITNFGRGRNMKLEKIYVVNPKGEIRPYFVSVERQINPRLF